MTKNEVHTKWTESEYQENALADFHAKAAATEAIRIVANVGKICSAFAKMATQLPDFCHPDVLVT